MKVRNVISVVAGVGVLVLVVYLFSEVRREPVIRMPRDQGVRKIARHEPDRARVESDAGAPSKRVPDPAPRPSLAGDDEPPPPQVDDSQEAEDNAKIEEATRLYDQKDYAAATKMAFEFLEARPRNNKMLWIMFSSGCATGDAKAAKVWFARLHPRYHKEARELCAEYGVDLGKIDYDDDPDDHDDDD